jgi:hypothetical protein
MMTNNINKYALRGLVCCGIAAALTSCRFEDEDYFDQPAAQRIESATEAIQQTLVSAPNGWVMQYFTGTDEIEGFNIFARFENSQKVTMAGNHKYLRDGNANKYTEYASLYEILKEDGPVLAFNTWNDILTPLVDPVDPSSAPNSLVKDGEGMKGDHNLVVLSYSPEEVLLRGERHSARVRLVPCESTWEEYIDATSKLKSYIANTTITNYYVVSGTDTLYFKNLRNGSFTYCERIDDPLFPSTVNCVFTPKGFRLHHQNSIGENETKFQEFTITADSTCLVSENDSVKVIPLWDEYLIGNTVVWKMDQETFSDAQRVLFDQISEALLGYNKNAVLANIGLGKSSGSNPILGLVFTFYSNAAKTKTNTIGMALQMTRSSYGQMQIAIPSEEVFDKNMEAVSQKAENIKSLARMFAETLQGIYNITPDNYFLPTTASFAPVGSGTAFRLSKP